MNIESQWRNTRHSLRSLQFHGQLEKQDLILCLGPHDNVWLESNYQDLSLEGLLFPEVYQHLPLFEWCENTHPFQRRLTRAARLQKSCLRMIGCFWHAVWYYLTALQDLSQICQHLIMAPPETGLDCGVLQMSA